MNMSNWAGERGTNPFKSLQRPSGMIALDISVLITVPHALRTSAQAWCTEMKAL